MDDAVRVEGVYKKYCRSLKRSMLYGMADIARNSIGLKSRSERLRRDEFWALEDVSFTMKRGDSLGLIGPNGSGKTTLLKMINGIFWPDRGKITTRGRVGALIAVGAGFHPLLTGRENIYINGAILGMSKKEVDAKFDEIVAFADIGSFLDSPVKLYSSGMFVRLGFAVAVHCEPQILLVDEVLAVGDKDFQMKCYRKIHEIIGNGATVILVAHNEYTIREYTTNAVYINKGKTRFVGATDDAISLYLRDMYEHRERDIASNAMAAPRDGKKAEIVSLKMRDRQGAEVTYIESGQELHIELECLFRTAVQEPVFGVNFYDVNGSGFFYGANSFYETVNFGALAGGRVKVRIKIPYFHLPSNNYLCSMVVAEKMPDNVLDWQDKTVKFIVGRARDSKGSIKLPTKWELETYAE